MSASSFRAASNAALLVMLSAVFGCAGVSDKSAVDPQTAATSGQPSALAQRAQMLFERALVDNEAIGYLRRLIEAAPKRLSGTPGDAAAVAHMLSEMQVMGLANVRAQTVAVPHWERGVEEASVLAPAARPLRVTALGGSVPTAPDGVDGEVVMVRTFEELRAMGAAAKDKIVFFNRPMPRAFRRTFRAYGQAVPQRSGGAVEAGKVGAKAVIVRSMTTTVDGYPHTGAMGYDEVVPKVPAAAIATKDAEALAELCKKGPVSVQLVLGCRWMEEAQSANVMGELRGSERPEEIVVIGGHLDAWDLGQGAHDDGAGCAHVLEALRLLQVCGIKPKRTIRAVLFANEESGLRGARGYASELGSESHVAAIETDTGGFSPLGFTCSLRDAGADRIRPWFEPLDAYGAGAFLPGGGGGADIAPLAGYGTVLFGMMTESHRYFDYHHSAADTIDKVNERELAMGAAALAYAASVLADRL